MTNIGPKNFIEKYIIRMVIPPDWTNLIKLMSSGSGNRVYTSIDSKDKLLNVTHRHRVSSSTRCQTPQAKEISAGKRETNLVGKKH